MRFFVDSVFLFFAIYIIFFFPFAFIVRRLILIACFFSLSIFFLFIVFVVGTFLFDVHVMNMLLASTNFFSGCLFFETFFFIAGCKMFVEEQKWTIFFSLSVDSVALTPCESVKWFFFNFQNWLNSIVSLFFFVFCIRRNGEHFSRLSYLRNAFSRMIFITTCFTWWNLNFKRLLKCD